jgi:hypothetical protein
MVRDIKVGDFETCLLTWESERSGCFKLSGDRKGAVVFQDPATAS